MDDRIIFAAKAPPTENGSKSASYVVLAEVSTVNGNSSTIKYHREIFNPRTFIPVQSTIDKDNSDRASQYCFTGTEDPDKPPSRHNAQQKTLIHCIHTDLSDNKSSTILTTTIYWKNNYWNSHRIFAASYQGLVLISHSNNENYEPMYQEVQQINPTTMETSIIYHSVSGRENADDDDYYSRPSRKGEKRISKFSILVGILVLGLTSAWLIIREGVPSGVIPFVYALVGILVLLFGYRKAFSGLSLTVGTVFFHCMIFFGGGWRGCRLPVWIGRDMYTWALYGWISAFLVGNIFDAYYVIIDTLAPVYLALTGIILGHPVVQIMGYTSIFMSFIFAILVLSNFVQYGFGDFDFNELIGYFLIPILIGVGLIVVGNWIPANRKFTAARCRHIDRYCRARYRPRQSSPP